MTDVSGLLRAAGIPTFDGYPGTGSTVPYVVVRPMILDPEVLALCGETLDWDFNFGVYCCAASVEASFNLAKMSVAALQGKRVGGSTLSCTMGYVGAQTESRYETQITVQINQGALQ
jgi:hypothetical protein